MKLFTNNTIMKNKDITNMKPNEKVQIELSVNYRNNILMQSYLEESNYEKLQVTVRSKCNKFDSSEWIFYSPQIAVSYLSSMVFSIKSILKWKWITDIVIEENWALWKILELEEWNLKRQLLNAREWIKLLSIVIKTKAWEKQVVYDAIKKSWLVSCEYKKWTLVWKIWLLIILIEIV